MKVIITGSTGMVGKGVLLECLENPDITDILLVSRSLVGIDNPKIKEVMCSDWFDLSGIGGELASDLRKLKKLVETLNS